MKVARASFIGGFEGTSNVLDEFSKLDFKLKSLEKKETEYRVSLSPRLKSLQSRIVNMLKAKELGES